MRGCTSHTQHNLMLCATGLTTFLILFYYTCAEWQKVSLNENWNLKIHWHHRTALVSRLRRSHLLPSLSSVGFVSMLDGTNKSPDTSAVSVHVRLMGNVKHANVISKEKRLGITPWVCPRKVREINRQLFSSCRVCPFSPRTHPNSLVWLISLSSILMNFINEKNVSIMDLIWERDQHSSAY